MLGECHPGVDDRYLLADRAGAIETVIVRGFCGK